MLRYHVYVAALHAAGVRVALAATMLLIPACGRSRQIEQMPVEAPAIQATFAVESLPTPPPLPTLPPTNTAVPIDTPTSPPPPTPSGTAPPSPTPTPTHPLSIETMRRQTYPGSEITFEQTLEPGDNYDRYIVSYLSEGNKIFALMTIPQGTKPASGWAVIVFNHGYIPPDEYRTNERYVAYVDAFARSGYIVFRSDYRGHGNSEGIARGGYGSPDYTVDVLNAVAAVRDYGDADAQRIGMWGHSMGGHITLRTMVISDEIKAGVIWAGVVASYPDMIDNWRRRAGAFLTATPDPTRVRGRWRGTLFDTYGTPEENPLFWATISANTYVGELSGPIQLHHGTGDESVPFSFSETLQAQIEAAGLPVELYLYEGDNHNIAANFEVAAQRSVAFFDRYVKGAG